MEKFEMNFNLTGKSFYNEWIKYNNIKMGFNIKFSLDTGENINYNILSPNDTFNQWQYLLNYLYDQMIFSANFSPPMRWKCRCITL